MIQKFNKSQKKLMKPRKAYMGATENNNCPTQSEMDLAKQLMKKFPREQAIALAKKMLSKNTKSKVKPTKTIFLADRAQQQEFADLKQKQLKQAQQVLGLSIESGSDRIRLNNLVEQSVSKRFKTYFDVKGKLKLINDLAKEQMDKGLSRRKAYDVAKEILKGRQFV
ncbi:hypothetical protein [Cysteiniphilum marinum]|uniref:hypothetical protein n=1 Tax=Cysteiniphilum marinum TaxID=2774191 RepID=UPI00193A8FC5|nr:hypothetical protein [Cysteiniphilum marinum]